MKLLSLWGVLRSIQYWHIMVTNWSPEIDACNGNLIVATNKVIAANKILTEHYMISLIDLSELNSKQIRYKNC
jgi:hypothetical protein